MIKKVLATDFVPETLEEEYALLIGRILSLEAFMNSDDATYINKKTCADILGISYEEKV